MHVVRTHVELSDETGNIAVLEVIWKNLFGKASLFIDVEAGTTLKIQNICTSVYLYIVVIQPYIIETTRSANKYLSALKSTNLYICSLAPRAISASLT